MEKDNFQAVLKRSVAMFNLLTGKNLTEREGNAFIQIFDLVDDYRGDCVSEAVQAANVLSHIEPDNIPPQEKAVTYSSEPQPVPAKGNTDSYSTVIHPIPVLPDDDKKRTDIDAAYQQREIEQAEEFDRTEKNIRKSGAAEKTAHYDCNDRRMHTFGFDWQMCALHRERDYSKVVIRCFDHEPTPEEFNEIYRLYDKGTHWVHLNKWDAKKYEWESITETYLTAHNQVIRNLRGTRGTGIKVSKSEKTPVLDMIAIANMGWEKPEFEWCITRKDGFTSYQATEPTRVDLVKASTTAYIATKRNLS